MHITFVKKLQLDGMPCRKCQDVEALLRKGDWWSRIDAVAEIDERDPGGEGVRLALEHGVRSAPFFVVHTPGDVRVFTVFLQFVDEILKQGAGADS
jgi:hypothetical protein